MRKDAHISLALALALAGSVARGSAGDRISACIASA